MGFFSLKEGMGKPSPWGELYQVELSQLELDQLDLFQTGLAKDFFPGWRSVILRVI
jgi:hypothetical protein